MQMQPKPYPSLGQGFLLILIAIGYSFVFGLVIMGVLGLAGIDAEREPFWNGMQNLLMYVFGIGATAYTAFLLRKFSGIRPLGFSLKLPSFPVVFTSIVAVLCIGYMLELFVYFVPIPDYLEEIFKEFLKNDVLSFVTAVIAAPVLEEILMRGIVLDGFLKRYSPSTSIIWSAVIFGLIHLNPWQAVAGIAAGLILGWVYWKTRSLLLCVLLHMVNNFVAFMQIWLLGEDTGPLVDTMGMGNYFIGLAAVFLVFIGCMRFLNRKLKAYPVEEPVDEELPM